MVGIRSAITFLPEISDDALARVEEKELFWVLGSTKSKEFGTKKENSSGQEIIGGRLKSQWRNSQRQFLHSNLGESISLLGNKAPFPLSRL